MTKKKAPTQQEIQDYLDGLNRTNNGVVVSADTARLEAIAVKNYCIWFEQHGIDIYRDEKAEIWKLGKKEKSGNDTRKNRTVFD